MKDCIFCKIVKSEIPCKKVWENKDFISFFDVSPQVVGHALVISKKHFKNILDFDISLSNKLFDCVSKTFEILKKDFGATGFNLVQNNFKSAGQIVDHLHFHILPRKEGDGYSLNLRK